MSDYYDLDDPLEHKSWLLTWIDRVEPGCSDLIKDWQPVLLKSSIKTSLVTSETASELDKLIVGWCTDQIGPNGRDWMTSPNNLWLFKYDHHALMFKLVWA